MIEDSGHFFGGMSLSPIGRRFGSCLGSCCCLGGRCGEHHQPNGRHRAGLVTTGVFGWLGRLKKHQNWLLDQKCLAFCVMLQLHLDGMRIAMLIFKRVAEQEEACLFSGFFWLDDWYSKLVALCNGNPCIWILLLGILAWTDCQTVDHQSFWVVRVYWTHCDPCAGKAFALTFVSETWWQNMRDTLIWSAEFNDKWLQMIA